MRHLGSLPEDDNPETRALFARSQRILNKMAREILGFPTWPTPTEIFPHPARSTPAVNRPVTPAPVEARKPPVATGALPAGTTVVREIKIEST